jgi:hypothetical protein
MQQRFLLDMRTRVEYSHRKELRVRKRDEVGRQVRWPTKSSEKRLAEARKAEMFVARHRAHKQSRANEKVDEKQKLPILWTGE